MMKKRIFILSFVILFLVSTTGLPVYYHYCEMMGKKSLTECDDCKIEVAEVVSCCSDMTLESQLQYTSENSNCCIDEFDYKKIEDNFFPTISTNTISVTTVISELHLTSLDAQSEKIFSQKTNYDLPPPKFGKQLLNTLHQLKIDLPLC